MLQHVSIVLLIRFTKTEQGGAGASYLVSTAVFLAEVLKVAINAALAWHEIGNHQRLLPHVAFSSKKNDAYS